MDRIASFSKDGQKSYCFIQVKDDLFPSIPKSTVKSWLRELKIKCRNSTEEERVFFKAAIPTLSGAFGVLTYGDLCSLVEYSKYKKVLVVPPEESPTSIAGEPPNKYKKKESPQHGCEPSSCLATLIVEATEDSKKVNAMVNNTDNSQSISQLIMNVDRTCYVVEDDSANCSSNSVASTGSVTPKATKPTEVGGKHASEQIEITNAEPMPIVIVPSSVATGHKSPTPSICVIEDIEEPVDKNAHASSPASQAAPTKYKGGNPRIRYGLSEEKMPQALKEEFKDFIKFYTVDINPLRNCCKYSDSTLDKVRERLMCFLGFVQRSYPTEVLSLKLAGNLPFVEGFVNYLKKNRKLMASTIGRILSAIVTGIKFTNQRVANVETLPVVISIRNMQKQLSREKYMVKRRKREGFSSEKGGQLLFAHILDAMRQLKEQYYKSPRLHHALVVHMRASRPV